MRIDGRMLTLVLTSTFLACSSLRIEVAQYVGEHSRSYRTRLAEARGEANLAVATIGDSPTLNAYFTKLPPTRRPADYLERINTFMDLLHEPVRHAGLRVPEAAGLPRPGEPVNPRAQLPESQPAELTGAPPAVVERALNALEKELREFGAVLSGVDEREVALEPDPEARARTVATVKRLNVLGQRILSHTEFPDYGELADGGHADQWVVINPVSTFGGLGKSEFVVFKDDAGNYQVKSAIFDPGDVVQAASATMSGVVTTLARLHGVPLPGAPQADEDKDLASGPLMEAETRDLAARSDRIRQCDQELAGTLSDLRARDLSAASFADDVAARRAVDRAKQALELYSKRVAPLLKKSP